MLSSSFRTSLSSTTLIFDLCNRFEFINLLWSLIFTNSNRCIVGVQQTDKVEQLGDRSAGQALVSFAAVIRVVTQCSSSTNGCSLELYIPFLKLTNKDQASISWKPGPLAANVTRNMIGAAANSYMHIVGSQ